MITKLYEVTCDRCGACINHYIGNRPTMHELKSDCGKVIISGSKTILICNGCIDKMFKMFKIWKR